MTIQRLSHLLGLTAWAFAIATACSGCCSDQGRTRMISEMTDQMLDPKVGPEYVLDKLDEQKHVFWNCRSWRVEWLRLQAKALCLAGRKVEGTRTEAKLINRYKVDDEVLKDTVGFCTRCVDCDHVAVSSSP
jgi:hypothetical protein